jgi:hypothetical protein
MLMFACADMAWCVVMMRGRRRDVSVVCLIVVVVVVLRVLNWDIRGMKDVLSSGGEGHH